MSKVPGLLLGLIAGTIAMLVSAIIWAVITSITGFQIGYMAIGVGVLVGIGIRLFGKGDGIVYGLMGAVLAFVGCVLGNYFTICSVIASEGDVSVIRVVFGLDIPLIFDLMLETFHPLDILFYIIAIMAGFNLSQAKDDEEESK